MVILFRFDFEDVVVVEVLGILVVFVVVICIIDVLMLNCVVVICVIFWNRFCFILVLLWFSMIDLF